MTKTEFLEEALKSPDCPENFTEMFALQDKYQKIAVSILRAFHKVCMRNKIEYQLAFGSLLGAVRDGGIIPWDYDVDVFVHAEDRDVLICALEDCLEEPFYYDTLENNPKRQGVLTRIGMHPYSTLHLHVDVFYLAGVPDNEKEADKFCRKLRRTSQIISAKHTPLFEINPLNSPRGWLQIALGKVLFLFANREKAFKRYLELSVLYDSRGTERVVNANSYAGTYYLTRKYVEKLVKFRTDDGEFLIPHHFLETLREQFSDYDGDFKSVPSLKSRIRETAEHYKEFLELEKQL